MEAKNSFIEFCKGPKLAKRYRIRTSLTAAALALLSLGVGLSSPPTPAYALCGKKCICGPWNNYCRGNEEKSQPHRDNDGPYNNLVVPKKSAEEIKKEKIKVWLKKGDAAMHHGNWTEAVNAYYEAYKLDKQNQHIKNKYYAARAQLDYSEGMKLSVRGKYDQAYTKFKSALQFSPDPMFRSETKKYMERKIYPHTTKGIIEAERQKHRQEKKAENVSNRAVDQLIDSNANKYANRNSGVGSALRELNEGISSNTVLGQAHAARDIPQVGVIKQPYDSAGGSGTTITFGKVPPISKAGPVAYVKKVKKMSPIQLDTESRKHKVQIDKLEQEIKTQKSTKKKKQLISYQINLVDLNLILLDEKIRREDNDIKSFGLINERETLKSKKKTIEIRMRSLSNLKP